ncbi:MAG: helix-turn-helix domain-containing protein [Acidimicrobiia bacterium]|nr:helix-turn-helix domain-containing protein [Acidimicrobiia bacterium]
MRVSRKHPATYIADHGVFPEGPYRKGTPSEVFLAAGLALRLKKEIEKDSIRYVAKMAKLSPQTLVNILHGKSWPDLLTIARLEESLGRRLWGSEHRKRPEWLPGDLYIPPGLDKASRRKLMDLLEPHLAPWNKGTYVRILRPTEHNPDE